MYYTLSKKCIFRREHYGGIIFKIGEDPIFLNKTGADICEALQISPLTPQEVEEILEILYLIPEGKSIKKDIFAVFDGLAEVGILVNVTKRKQISISQTVETLKSERIQDTSQYPTAPVAVNLYLRYECNQSCVFCYLDGRLRVEESRGRLSESELKRAISDFIECRVPMLVLTGGEPTKDFDLLCKLVEYVDDRMQVFINTNGSYNGGISKQQARRLAKLSVKIQVSIEGITPALHDKLVGVKGAHHCATRSVKNLIKEGAKVILQTVPMKQNIGEIVPLLMWAKGNGAEGLVVGYLIGSGEACRHFNTLSPHPRDYEDLIRTLMKYKRRFAGEFHITLTDPFAFLRNFESEWPPSWEPKRNPLSRFCGAGTYHIDVAPSGDLYPCPATHGIERFRVGNIRRRRFIELWNNPRLNFFREASQNNPQNPFCQTCKYFPICKGGCPITAKSILGNEYAGQPNCPKIVRAGS